MTDRGEVPARARRGMVAKRDAIARAARMVFGRDGYSYTKIDTIATEANVSTRTIYNHFGSKEQLFATVIHESSTLIADTLTRIIERHLNEVTELENALIALGHDWATTQTKFADHFALSRQINAEVAHLPQNILDTYHEAGPERAQRVLAHHMRQLHQERLLHVDNATQAANHFIWLVAGEITSRSHHGAAPLDDEDITEIITAGTRAFLYGYLPRQ